MKVCPTGAEASGAVILKAFVLLAISLRIASLQKVVPVSLSICNARSIVFGISVPCFCSRRTQRLFILPKVLSRVLSAFFTHQANAGSSRSSLLTACSATCKRCNSFESLSECQDVEPSFHWQRSCQPLVVILGFFWLFGIVTNASSLVTAVESFL